jgi:hypothetical protein
MRSALATLVVALALAAPTSAADGSVQLTILGGRLWLVARDATVAQILAEWARVGQTTIVNADRVPGGRVTLELPGVPERQALDLLLRSVSGFVATTRSAQVATVGARSEFERIVIVAASQAPAVGVAAQAMPAPSPAPQQPPMMQPIAPGVQRILGSDGRPVADDQEDAPTRATQPPPASMPPGFAAPPQTAAPNPAAPPAPAGTAPQTAPGVPVPGMIWAPPKPPGQPQRPPR